jgi:hypothetical protein
VEPRPPASAVFFISGHGFGHASRQVEVIHALAALEPDLRIIVRSAVNPGLLHRTLAVPFDLRPGPCDTGIVQASSIEHDDPATVKAAVEFYRTYEGRIDAEARALRADRVALVVSDIAPIAFEVACRLGVPSVAIANFTWDWIYETHPGLVDADAQIVPRLRASYRKATLALELPFSAGFEIFAVRRALPLVARRATRLPADTRRRFDLPPDRPALLLSFGGYGLPQLNLRALDCLQAWTVVTTDRIAAPTEGLPPAVRLIPEDAFRDTGFRYEDLVAAVDVVLTKPGYGIIAECISTGTAMLYTSRGSFREYDVLVGQLPRYVRSRFIGQPDLLAGRWLQSLDAVRAQPAPPAALPADGARHAARALKDVLDASRSGRTPPGSCA